MTTGDVEDVVVTTLGPFLGDSMARGAIKSQIAKLKLASPLKPGDIEALLQGIAGGLNVFVGKNRAAELMQKLRAQLVPA